MPKINRLIPWILVAIATSGCDDRATRIAREAADRQAQQNTSMAELNKEVASGTHQLVAADSQARKEIIGVHHELQSERTRLDNSRDALEQERHQIAVERRTESLLAPVIELSGGVLLVVVLLGFCWYAVVASRSSDDTDAQLNELLVHEFVVDASLLPRVDHSLLTRSPPGH